MEDGGWFNSKNVFIKDTDLQNRMLDVFGVYWHIIVKVRSFVSVHILKLEQKSHTTDIHFNITTFQIMILLR